MTRRILVIDDSEVILARIKQVLVAEDYEVTTSTSSVGNARHLLSCDMAIIDFHMPGLDGATVVQTLRGAAAKSSNLCLFYLYTSDRTVAVRYAELGFDGCFTGKGNESSLARQVKSAFRMNDIRAVAAAKSKNTPTPSSTE